MQDKIFMSQCDHNVTLMDLNQISKAFSLKKLTVYLHGFVKNAKIK